MARLRDFPEIGAIVEGIGDPTVREIVFEGQRVQYRYNGATVLILTVFHGSHTPDLVLILGE